MITKLGKRSLTGLAEKPTTFICVNGILGSSDGWQQQAANWGNANTPFGWSYYYYWTGLFRWGQSHHVKELADLIKKNPVPPIVIGHSNGCSVILEALQSDAGVKTKDIHLFAAAAYADCRDGWWKNGLNTAFARGQLARAFIYTSTGDEVLKFNWLDPAFWGRNMGVEGPIKQNVSLTKVNFDKLSACDTIVQAVDNTKNHEDWVYLPDGKTVNTPNIQAIANLYAASI